MGSAALQPSIALGRLLRRKRKELRLTLREVSDRMAERGDRIPISTLTRIEHGKLDPGVRRLHLLLRLYEVPPHLVADLVELETLAVEQPVGQDLETLYREGVEHWKEGNIAQGLAYLFAVREHVPDDQESQLLRQKATLAFAIAARNLGKFRLARQIVDELLCEPPDPSLIVDVLVLASSLWRGLGSLEVSLALVRQATTHLRPEDHKETAWVLHQEAKVLLEAGRPKEAEQVLARALKHYRSLGDTYGEEVALILRVGVMEKLGQTKKAFACAREVLRLSESHGHARLVISGHLELGRLLVKSGRAGKGLDALREGLGQAVLLGDRNAEFLAHYHLWKAHEQLGDQERARFELEAASYFVRFIDDFCPEADEIHRLLKEGGHYAKSGRPSEFVHSPQ